MTRVLSRTDHDSAADAKPNTGVAVYGTSGDTAGGCVGGKSVGYPIIAATYALTRAGGGATPAQYRTCSTSGLYESH